MIDTSGASVLEDFSIFQKQQLEAQGLDFLAHRPAVPKSPTKEKRVIYLPKRCDFTVCFAYPAVHPVGCFDEEISTSSLFRLWGGVPQRSFFSEVQSTAVLRLKG